MNSIRDAVTSQTLKTAWEYFTTAAGMFVGQVLVTIALMAAVRVTILIFGRFL